MKYNRFYNSDIYPAVSDSEVIFLYKRVKLHRDGKVIFPFYLVMKPFQVEFNYYGPKFTTAQPHEREETDFNPVPGERELPELKHRELFTLTLSDDYSVNKMLEKELQNIYSGSIDLSRFTPVNETNAQLHSHAAIEYELETDTRDLYNRDEQINRNKEEEAPQLSYNSIKPAGEPDDFISGEHSGIIAYRTLLLDFLYDLIETEKTYNDFAYNPYFDEVEQRLMASHFLFALAMMYSYKYREKKIKTYIDQKDIKEKTVTEAIKRIQKMAVMQDFVHSLGKIINDSGKLSFTDKSDLDFLFQQYHISELCSPWLKYYEKNRGRGSLDKLWQEFLKQELIYQLKPPLRDAVHHVIELRKAQSSWMKALNHEQAVKTIDPANKWFNHIEVERELIFGIQKYESKTGIERFRNFFRNIFHFRMRKRYKFHCIQKLIELSAYINLEHELYYETENEKLDTSARWFLDRYHISDAFKLYSPWFTVFIKLFVLGVLLFSIAELFTLVYKDFQTGFNDWLFAANLLAILLFAIISALAFGKSLALIGASQFGQKHNRWFPYTFFLRIKYRQNRLSGRIIGFFMPKLLMAIFSGWIILLTAEEVWKSVFDVYIENAVAIALVLMLIIFIYVMLEIQKIKPKLTVSQVFTRTAFLIAFGLFYSNLIGITTIALSSERMLVRSGYLEYNFEAIIDKEHNTVSPFLDSNSIDSIKKILHEDKDSVGYAKDERLLPYLEKIFTQNEEPKHRLTYFPNKVLKIFLPDRLVEKFSFIRIFPGMLLVNTVIALFIGIFLQMLFDRRNIAEPI
ncbi:MAG: hypothetical protein K9H15_05030 [Bacteroidales bacterium]|nr:hypothetical protein [Bacteroidales bacterium]